MQYETKHEMLIQRVCMCVKVALFVLLSGSKKCSFAHLRPNLVGGRNSLISKFLLISQFLTLYTITIIKILFASTAIANKSSNRLRRAFTSICKYFKNTQRNSECEIALDCLY